MGTGGHSLEGVKVQSEAGEGAEADELQLDPLCVPTERLEISRCYGGEAKGAW